RPTSSSRAPQARAVKDRMTPSVRFFGFIRQLMLDRTLTLSSIVLLAAALPGCSRDPLVSVELINRTGGACDRAYGGLKGTTPLFNANVPNGDSSITGGFPYPMPATATLRWSQNKVEHTATVDVPPQPPQRASSLHYLFVILPDGRAKAA